MLGLRERQTVRKFNFSQLLYRSPWIPARAGGPAFRSDNVVNQVILSTRYAFVLRESE